MKKKDQTNFQKFKELFADIGVLVIIIICIRTFIVSPFEVEGLSMYETLHDRDYIVIDKLSYRIGTPERGDIVVVRPPHIDKRTYFVKRIIGLPGETVEFKDGYVFINDKKINEPYFSPFLRTRIARSAPTKVTVPEGAYYIMGDNRDHSSDSRSWMTAPEFISGYNDAGAIPKKYITGKVMLVAFNMNKPFGRWKPIEDIRYTFTEM